VPIHVPRNSYFKEGNGGGDVPGAKEIQNFDELRRLRLADEGYFVITDTARPAIIHKVNAKCINADNFNIKVSINRRKQGSYFWVDSIAAAAREFGARRCKVCRPELTLDLPSNFDN
jgi:hypothetical protein